MDMRLAIGAAVALTSLVAPLAFAADAGVVSPRKPLGKLPTERLLQRAFDADGKVVTTGRLVVKFHDSIRARAGTNRGRTVQSLAAEDLRDVDALLSAHRLTIRQAINRDPARLKALEMRAQSRTNRAQIDLAGMMYVEGPLDALLVVAPLFNEMPIVEFVEFERELGYHIAPAPAPAPGGPPACGDFDAGNCFEVNGSLSCDDLVCCTTVAGFNITCVDEQFGGTWDILCVNLANLVCADGDRCETQLVNGGCFEAHPTAGCNESDCCNLVGGIEPFCVQFEWDQTCVNLAAQFCNNLESDCCAPNPAAGCDDAGCEAAVCADLPACCDTAWDVACAQSALELCGVCDVDGVPTPDFSMSSADPTTRLQKYTTPEPAGPGNAFFDLNGLTGDGLDIAGMEALGQALLDEYGVGDANGARGLGIRVGVVEHSAHVTGPKGGELWHEDLLDVIPEPGQTIITLTGGVLSPDHGTAVLGQIVGAHNDIGVSGIARDAQGYFFPIVSVEEGGRTLNAIISALELFEEGDVLNYSIGPGGIGTLVSDGATWAVVELGTQLGITSVISAGNSCGNIDPNGQFQGQDSGAIIVGACWPGVFDGGWPPALGLGRFCRLGFSNHCVDCDGANVVHVAAWGIAVTTTGYGDLFSLPSETGAGVNASRAYTAGFSGTSSAAPIIAGYAACLQGLAKQFYGTPLTPAALRGLIAGSVWGQCDLPNPALLPGPGPNPCGPDVDENSDPRRIGGFPNAADGAFSVITGNFFSASPLTDVKVITGNLVFGNVNSLKQIDGNTLRVNSRRMPPGGQGNGTPPAITYLVPGETTDIEVTAATLLPVAEVLGLNVQSVLTATVDFVIHAMYVYNYQEQRWTFLPQLDIIGPGGNFMDLVVPLPTQHVSESGQMKVRVWTSGLGNVPRHQILHDFVDIRASLVPIFEPVDP